MSRHCGHEPAEVVARQPLFKSLTETECQALVRRSLCRRFPRNGQLFREGDACRGLYLVVDGAVRVYRANASGQEQVLGTITAGEWLGEVSPFDEGPYLASARATEDSRLLFLPLREVQALYRTSTGVAHAVVREMGSRVRTLVALVDRLTLQDVATRVAVSVLDYAEEGGALQGAPFRLPRTQEDLAAELGTTRESVARALHDLRAAGVIRQRGARIELLDLAELHRRAGRANAGSAGKKEPWSTQPHASSRRAVSRVAAHVS